MNNKIKKIIKILSSQNKTLSTMESCTGGGLVDKITSVPDASKIIKFSAVTYSNDFKIKMGVDKNIIDKYSVYSTEVSNEMSKNIAFFSNSNYGIGITGKLNKPDTENNFGKDNIVYISIYDKDNNKFYNKKVEVTEKSRPQNKLLVINNALDLLLDIIN